MEIVTAPKTVSWISFFSREKISYIDEIIRESKKAIIMKGRFGISRIPLIRILGRFSPQRVCISGPACLVDECVGLIKS